MGPEHREVLASAARTTSVNSEDIVVPGGIRGVRVVIDATAAAATPSVVATIQGKDPTSGEYFDLLASSAITGTGTTVLVVYPGCIAAANAVANLPIGSIFRVEMVAADTDSLTYSVGIDLLP